MNEKQAKRIYFRDVNFKRLKVFCFELYSWFLFSVSYFYFEIFRLLSCIFAALQGVEGCAFCIFLYTLKPGNSGLNSFVKIYVTGKGGLAALWCAYIIHEDDKLSRSSHGRIQRQKTWDFKYVFSIVYYNLIKCSITQPVCLFANNNFIFILKVGDSRFTV